MLTLSRPRHRYQGENNGTLRYGRCILNSSAMTQGVDVPAYITRIFHLYTQPSPPHATTQSVDSVFKKGSIVVDFSLYVTRVLVARNSVRVSWRWDSP